MQGNIYLILHRANRLKDIHLAHAAGLDFIEVDLRLVNGAIECWHDMPVHAKIPIFSLWRGVFPYIHHKRLSFWDMAHYLASCDNAPRLFLDIKDKNPEIVSAILDILRSEKLVSRTSVSTPFWEHLDTLARVAPDIACFYTIVKGEQGKRQWSKYSQRLLSGNSGSGVSAYKDNADPVRMQFLRFGGLYAVCGTVNNYHEAVRLIEQGAGGIISDNIEMLAQLKKDFFLTVQTDSFLFHT